jgi:hypothetical protein
MDETTFIACEHCQAEGHVLMPALEAKGPLVCPNCTRLLSMIGIEPWKTRIETMVARMADRQRVGVIGTRKQSFGQSDTAIDRDGREAELAACLLLCPGNRERWFDADGPNRGRDLPATWTGLPQAVEVKQTRYCDSRRGFLLVRPPRNTPGPMRSEYIDDCLYVLMHGQNGLYRLLGWADRPLLLTAGDLNPVPVRPGQRECWGIHWTRLYRLEQLRSVLGSLPR